MRHRFLGLVVTLAMGSACAPVVPDSGAGVGFGEYDDYLRRQAAIPQTLPPLTGTAAPDDTAISSDDLAAAGIGNTGQDVVDTATAPLTAIPARTQGLEASPSNSEPSLFSDAAPLSDEQNFEAVSARESIESDAERLAAAAAARQEAEVTALPSRPGDAGPNIVAYALSAPGAVGQQRFRRLSLMSERRFQRNCASYNTPDAAQRDFLARGGPERDLRGLDPDGDGFACGWDPAPFRLAADG